MKRCTPGRCFHLASSNCSTRYQSLAFISTQVSFPNESCSVDSRRSTSQAISASVCKCTSKRLGIDSSAQPLRATKQPRNSIRRAHPIRWPRRKAASPSWDATRFSLVIVRGLRVMVFRTLRGGGTSDSSFWKSGQIDSLNSSALLRVVTSQPQSSVVATSERQ